MTRFKKDIGLSTRMYLVMGLLAVIYFVVFYTILYLCNGVLWIPIIFSGIFLFCQFYFSSTIVFYAMGCKKVSESEAPRFHRIIDKLCMLSNMKKPKCAISSMSIPNAFATGRNANNALVCVTQGLLDSNLTDDELEGVLAHELSHIAHRDVFVMTFASFIGIVIGLISRTLFYSMIFSDNRRDRRDDNSGVNILIMLAVSIVTYIFTTLLSMALSRYRELSADRAGAILTGKPSALGSALVKISGEIKRIPEQDIRSKEFANAFFFCSLHGKSIMNLFSTHPPLDKRLKQLNKISVDLRD